MQKEIAVNSSPLNEVALEALRTAIASPEASLLIAKGKEKGLIPRATGKANQEAKKACLDGENPLFLTEREEKRGNSTKLYVKLSSAGIEALIASVPLTDFADMLGRCAEPYAEPARQIGLRRCLDHQEQLQVEEQHLDERKRRCSTIQAIVDAMKLGIEQDEQRLAEKKLQHEELMRMLSRGEEEKPPEPLSDPDKHKLGRQLIREWESLPEGDARAAFERSMFNFAGMRRYGNVGEIVIYDRNEHQSASDSPFQPGERGKIVEAGWQFVSRHGPESFSKPKVQRLPSDEPFAQH